MPSAYQQVEYLESANESNVSGNYGLIYIDTGVDYFADFEIDSHKPNGNSAVFCGAKADYYLSRSSSSAPYFNFKNGTAYWLTTVPVSTRTKWRWQNNQIYKDDVYAVPLNKSAVSGDFILYGGYVDGYKYSNIRIYSFKAWNSSGVLIRDMRPCYRKTDNVKGFYDLVTGVFLTGTGTGYFIAGDDI